MAVKAKIGVCVMALLEDDYNKTGHMREAATAAAQEIADTFAQWGEVVHAGLVEEEWQAANAAKMFNAADVDLIVMMELAYTKGLVPARVIIDTTQPILVWNAQKIRRLDEKDGFDVVMLNSGMAGMPELTAVLLRTGREYALVTSLFGDEAGRKKVQEVIQAAAVRRKLRETRVALVGHNFEGMTDLMFDGLSMRETLGPVYWPLEPEKVAVRVGQLDQALVDQVIAEERAKYTIDMDAGLFEKSVRLAIALEQLVKENKFDAFCALDQVWLTDPRVGVIPSYGTGRLCEIGIPAAPEGDVNTAVAQVILHELAGQATTLENYVVDYDQNAVMFSHDGHGNPAMGTPGAVKVKSSIYYHGVHGFGAGFEFSYKPGHITNLAVVTTGLNQWRFVISEGELLPFPPREISAPQTLFRHDTLDIADWCDGWLRAGATHHQGAAYGSWTAQLLHLAQMLGIEAVVV